MLTKLTLEHLPSYGPRAEASNLQTINFIFGPNGSGKTSITKAMESGSDASNPTLHWRDPDNPTEICTYNRDYVDSILHSSTTMPGVFALGEGSSATLQRIDELSSEKGEIAKARKKVEGLTRQLAGSESKPGPTSRLLEVRASFEDKAWEVRQSLPAQVRSLLTGNMGTKRLFTQRVLTETSTRSYELPGPHEDSSDNSTPRTSDFGEFILEMSDLIGALNNDNESADQDISCPARLKLDTHAAYPLFETPIISTSDTVLARALRQKGSIDWAVLGIEHLDDTNECPMCLQSLDDSLLEAMLGLSDQQYAYENSQIAEFSEFLSRKQGVLALELEAIRTLMPASPDLSRSLSDVERVASELQDAVTRKLRHPSERSSLPDIDSKILELDRIVTAENNLRRRRREQRSARKDTLAQYTSDTWGAIAEHLAPETRSLKEIERELEQQIQEQRDKISAAEDDLATLEEELEECRGSIRTHRPWMDKVNGLLTNIGFSTFRFDESDAVEGAYTLIRNDGSPANDTLSEGERTFESFMYYVSLLDSIGDSPTARGKLAVIDDPIASLDSDILFVVSALIKKLMLNIHEGKTVVSQAIVLTHNIHFLKEVSYLRAGEGTAPRAFYVLNKTQTGTVVSQRGNRNPVEVEYVRLWKQIGEWRGETGSSTGLQNAMRRVIEYYFQTIGRVDERSLVAEFSGDDQIVVKSFFSWVNEGSHSLFDGLYFAPTSTSTEKYFEVFEELFTVSGHKGHFEMMSTTWS